MKYHCKRSLLAHSSHVVEGRRYYMDLLELKFQIVVSCHTSTRNQAQVLWKEWERTSGSHLLLALTTLHGDLLSKDSASDSALLPLAPLGSSLAYATPVLLAHDISPLSGSIRPYRLTHRPQSDEGLKFSSTN